MKKFINGELVEGTPEEILAYEVAHHKLIGRDASLSQVAQPYVPKTPPLVDELTNEDRLNHFRETVSVTPRVADRYVAQLRLLEQHVRPRPLLSAGPKDVAAVRDQLLSKCANLGTMKTNTKTPGVHYCRQGLFLREIDARPSSGVPVMMTPGEKPSFCRSSCSQYAFSPHPAGFFLMAVKRFFEHYEEMVPRNPARRLVVEFFEQYDLEEYLGERYCPTLEETRRLLSRARDLRGLALLAILAKTGRRLDEVRRLRWSDIDLDQGIISLDRVREEKRRAAGRGRTKMRAGGFRKAFIDKELSMALSDYYTNFWSVTVRKDAQLRPVTDALWLNRARNNSASRSALEGWVDGAIRDAGLWNEHGPSSGKRISAHCFRHFFTTILQTGQVPAPREFVKLLRGDVLGDAMQRYEHVPLNDLRETYLRHMPRLLP